MKFKNLNRYRTGGTHLRPQLGVPLPRTPGGRVYRYSPNEEAYPRHFVLGGAAEGIEVKNNGDMISIDEQYIEGEYHF